MPNKQILQSLAICSILAGCSTSIPIANDSKIDAVATVNEEPPFDVRDYVKKLGATGRTASILVQDITQNNRCRADDIASACPVRDKLSKQLTARGWCYGEDAIDGAHAEWAKCKVRMDPVITGEPQESEKLIAYEKHIEQPLADRSNARILTECGWRRPAWYAKISAVLAAMIDNDPAKPSFTESEDASLATWELASQKDHIDFVFGKDPNNRCTAIKAEPWQDRLDKIEALGAV